MQVDGRSSTDDILRALDCPEERMLSQQASPDDGGDDGYVYRRGDIPIFNLDEQDKLLIKTLTDLIEALR